MYSVLLVEDDDDYSELLELALTDSGYQVKVASRATKALKMIKQHDFDLILCDVLMPEMDGFEFLLEVKALNIKSKIIMMSGGGVEKTELYLENSTAAGCDAVLRKPFLMKELTDLIHSPEINL
ncbi:hypothetical protein MNBD_GAMMA22-2453 [hydrothermal vent metagenome]|uniref:Response regulatory domain-containing protein n=1 Tax=hydrothermal vent metagenome TaxID=652676 RepID=A0A3B1AFP9_9ZZZZ